MLGSSLPVDRDAANVMGGARRNGGGVFHTASRALLLAAMALAGCSAVRPSGLGERCGANFLCEDGFRCNGRQPPVCTLERGRCMADGDCEGGLACRTRPDSKVGTCD